MLSMRNFLISATFAPALATQLTIAKENNYQMIKERNKIKEVMLENRYSYLRRPPAENPRSTETLAKALDDAQNAARTLGETSNPHGVTQGNLPNVEENLGINNNIGETSNPHGGTQGNLTNVEENLGIIDIILTHDEDRKSNSEYMDVT